MSKVDNNSMLQTTLGELVSKEKKSIISGPFGSNVGKRFFKKEGIPLIRGNNLTKGEKKFKDNGFVFLTREKADELNCYAIKNDLIFTAVGTIGQVGIIDEKLKFDEYVISNKQLRVRFDISKITPLFAYYWFSSYWIQKLILQRNVGSTVPLINLGVLKGLPITLPKSISIQNNIVDVLENIYLKIALNNKINQELEAMAKLIYDYWFVQFDFPDKNGKPYKTSGGKMVFNEELKREVPEDWEVDIVGNILATEQLGGKTLSSEYFISGSIPIIDQSTKFICGYTNNESKRIETKVPRIVFGDHTRILKLINFDFARGADGIQVLLSKEERVPQHFFYHSLLKIDLSNYGYARHFKFLKDTKIIIPNLNIVERFEEKAKVWYDMIWANRKQNQKLAELRDWLLPMLMNGQVTVNNYELGIKNNSIEGDAMNMAAEPRKEYKKK